MADTNALIIGCKQIEFGVAAPTGTMPTTTKVGKVYKGTCTISQDAAEVTEHYEEDKSVPAYRAKDKKAPVLSFSLMVETLQELVDTIGGELDDDDNPKTWGFSGDETAKDRAVRIITKQGGKIEIPNADIDGSINAELSKGGIFLVDVTVTPMAVSAGKAFSINRATATE